MRRLSLVLAAGALFALVTPVPAQATGGGTVDQLSGPGPFFVLDIEWRIACIQDPHVEKTNSSEPLANDGTVGLRSLDSFEKGLKRSLAALGGAGCLIGHDKNPSGSFNFKFAHWWSLDSPFQYASGISSSVGVWQFETNFATFADASRFFELNSGAGVLFFRGEAFD